MAAQRLGSFLSNATGTAGQVLRVKEDESGFEMYTPAGIPDYTITNDTEDRTIDAQNTSSDELANVLSTLIKDIKAANDLNGGFGAFQWSTSEQVYPFEKASDGSTLYCKEINFGTLPNSGTKDVAHGITGFTPSKLHRFECIGANSAEVILIPHVNTGTTSNQQGMNVQLSVVRVFSGYDASSYTAKFRLVYAK